jgi:hypothetical protein
VLPLLPLGHALLGKAEAVIGQRQEHDRHADPEQPALHHQVRHGHRARVELGRREVARARHIGGHAERVGKHPESEELRLPFRQPLPDQVEDEDADYPDEGPGRRAGRRGEREQNGRDDQHVRERDRP